MKETDVLVVGAGPAGLSCGIFTARAGLDTVLVGNDDSILRRNSHLENYLGFPAGVNSRLLLDMGLEQAERNGCDYVETGISDVGETENGYVAQTEDGENIDCRYLVAASWSSLEYIRELDVETIDRGKEFAVTDDDGRTEADGVYAAGRIAGNRHQALVAAGDGADVGLTVIRDSEVDFYHDWVAPEGYFTGRGREVPPGCVEIDEEERERRERESIDVMRSYFDEVRDDEPVMHPSVDGSGG
ncbi:MAG: NAD(P)/FAD-dependent oxidoreductase [Halobacteria archaeon]